jgi:sugar/nucleoside kinase (ribokinase family)
VSVLVVGSVALDSVRTPFGEAKDALGGSASYFAAAARHFSPVAVIAVVGEDFPPQHLKMLEGMDGVDLTSLERAKGATFRWAGEYAQDLNTRTTLDTQLNVFADFNPRLNPRHCGLEFVFLANIHPELQNNVLDQVKKPRYVVLDTMNYWIQNSRKELERTLARVDAVLLNDEEARMLSGSSNIYTAARNVIDMGPSLVVVKKGEHGAVLIAPDFIFTVPAFPLESVSDPTGAGDSFAGGFVGYLSTCKEPRDENALRAAAAHGVVCASFAVESFSLDRLAKATREEVDARLKALRELVRF